jgi:hypothetical protein
LEKVAVVCNKTNSSLNKKGFNIGKVRKIFLQPNVTSFYQLTDKGVTKALKKIFALGFFSRL